MDEKQMRDKVLFVDPWGIGSPAKYTNGICTALSQYVDLTLATNYYFPRNKDNNFKIMPIFFKYSENMSMGTRRRLIRGVEYLWAWKKIIHNVKRNSYDIVHINWLLLYKLDVKFLRILKKKNVKVIYTAHNVIPHEKLNPRVLKEQSVYLKEIYSLTDKIIIHGKNILKEFQFLFPNDVDKIYIQKHGCNENPDIEYDVTKIEKNIVDTIKRYEKIALFIGEVYYNKGADRLLKIWLGNEKLKESLLVVAGKETKLEREYIDDYRNLKQKCAKQDNILILDYYISDNELNYLMSHTSVVILPYRHASMSGVIFSAADFAKPIIATDVGAFSEYLDNVKGAFLVGNSTESIKNCLYKIIQTFSKQDLDNMGQCYKESIIRSCTWEVIVKKMFEACY